MKTNIVLTLLLLACFVCGAQVTLQPLVPQTGAFQKSQLWNALIVNNTVYSINGYMVLSLQNRETGTEILSATTTDFVVDKGAKQLNAAVLTPIQYTYFSFSGNSADDFLPVGSYNACYKLVGGKNATLIAEACIPFDVTPLSPPILITPADSSELQVQPAMFTWQPPAPLVMFQQLHYELVIAEILPGQKPEEAIELNAPIYTDLNIQSTVMNYTGAYPSLEKDKWYAWQVVALDGESYAAKTEVWDFIISQKTAQSPTIQQSYIKLKNAYEAGFTICKDYLKIEYENEINDQKAIYRIIDLQNKNSVVKTGELVLNPGQNFIDIALDKKFKINKNYVFELTNTRAEKWSLRFTINK